MKYLRFAIMPKSIVPVCTGAILFIFLISFNASAQNVWSLQKCVDYALKNNISIKQSELNTQSADAHVTQSYAAFLPALNGNASQFYDFGRSVDPLTNTFTTSKVVSTNFSIGASVTLFNGFQMQNTLKQSKLDYLSSTFDLKKIANDISLNVVSDYLQVLFSIEGVGVANQQLVLIKKQEDNTSKLVDAGSLPRGSLLDIKAQVATNELNLINAQNTLDLAYLSLKQLLDLDSVCDFEIIKPILEVTPFAIISNEMDQIYLTAEKRQPEILSADIKEKSSETALAIARGGRSPRISMSGNYGTGYSDQLLELTGVSVSSTGNYPIIGFTTDSLATPVKSIYPLTNTNYTYQLTPFGTQLKDNLNKSVGFSLSLPLFNNWNTNTNIKRAKINLVNAKYNSESVRLTLKKSIEQAYYDASAAYKKYNATLVSVESLKEAFNYAQQKFDVGLITSYDFLNAKNNLDKAQSDLIQAKYDYLFKTKILDFYQGKSLSF
jgi:outer membrane protein